MDAVGRHGLLLGFSYTEEVAGGSPRRAATIGRRSERDSSPVPPAKKPPIRGFSFQMSGPSSTTGSDLCRSEMVWYQFGRSLLDPN